MNRSGDTGCEETDNIQPEEHAIFPSQPTRRTATLLPKPSEKKLSKIPSRPPKILPRCQDPQDPPKIFPGPQDHPNIPQDPPKTQPRSSIRIRRKKIQKLQAMSVIEGSSQNLQTDDVRQIFCPVQVGDQGWVCKGWGRMSGKTSTKLSAPHEATSVSV